MSEYLNIRISFILNFLPCTVKNEGCQIDADAARSMAEDVINTPEHGVNRVIVIKNGQIIVDYPR